MKTKQTPSAQNAPDSVRIHHAAGSGHSWRDFLPLIGVISVVLLLTVAGVWYFNQPPMLAFMGYFFLVFGALKAARLPSFVEAFAMYDVLAMRSRTYAYVYPFLELGFGLAYLFGWYVVPVSVVVLVVMLIGAWGVYKKLRAKEEIPCACLGTVFKVPMTWVTLGEDLLMAAMAAVLIVMGG